MVMAHTLVQRLASLHAELQLQVVAPPATAPLAYRMQEVQHVHTADFPHGEFGFGKRRELGNRLKSQGFDQAFVLPNSWKSALVPFFAAIPKRTGWQGEARYGLLNDRRKLDKAAFPLMIERFMALAGDNGELPAKPYPLPKLMPDPENLEHCLRTHNLDAGQVAVLCPGAEFGAAKKWPVVHYAQVARVLLQQGWQVWLMGSPKDQPDCDAIVEALPRTPGLINLAGKTSLLDAVDLLSVAQQVICNDSGLMHVACALSRPTIGIFGSTSPDFTPPLGARAVVVEQSLACRPCFQRTCPLGHLDCLQTLMPAQVLQHVAL
jgi:lipopolysaccharide heptosyltransferase II